MNKLIKILSIFIVLLYSAGSLAESNSVNIEKQDIIYAHYRGYGIEFEFGIAIEGIKYIDCYQLTREQYNQIIALLPKKTILLPNIAGKAILRKYFDVRLAIHDAGDGDIFIGPYGKIFSDKYIGVVDTEAIRQLFYNFENLEKCDVCPFDNRVKIDNL